MDTSAFEVVELRRYVVQPQQRDTLIDLFEREFIETQEACGMVPVGHYRDFRDPNSFVWFRGFSHYDGRAAALHAFYGESRAWRDNRTAANATLIDSDNVLMLRSARHESGFDLRGLIRPSVADATPASRSTVTTAVFMLDRAADESLIAAFEQHLLPQLQRCSERIAYFVTDHRPNAYPRLPVREEEYAFVVSGSCATVQDAIAWRRAIEAAPLSIATGPLVRSRDVLDLDPAARSLFR